MLNTSPADYNELMLRLYRLSHEQPVDRFQDATMQLLKTVLPFDASMWVTARTSPIGMDVHTLHLFQKSPEMMADYVPFKEYDTAAAQLFKQRRGTCGLNVDHWYHRPHEREFRDYLHRYQQDNIFISIQHNTETCFGEGITLFRSQNEQHCLPHEVQLLDQLAPHLMQALTINRVIHLDRLHATTRQLRGAAIADLHGVLYHADPNFEEMLRAEWPAWRAHSLPEAALTSFLRGHTLYTGASVVLTQHAEHGLLFIKARPRCAADSLSPREHTVAQLMAKGQTYKQIAHLLQRAPSTVRNQIQSIYDKLEVNSVAELIAELRWME